MTVVPDAHEALGATYRKVDGQFIVDHYGRPERTHHAVRNGVGVLEMGYGVVELTGDDRVNFVDNGVSNRIPDEDGRGVYALLLNPQGHIRTDLYVYNAGDRLLCFTPPTQAEPLAEEWADNTFIQDVNISVSSQDFGVFGVHGPMSTEKVASVLNGAATPDEQLSFVRGSMGDSGVTVVRGDGLCGEEGYEVICTADAAEEVFDTLVTRGANAVPFGYRTWNTLTLEAGTPLFETELKGQVPNVLGLRKALDFEKGCYVGQEVVSKIENRGRPSRQLVGLAAERLPNTDAAVFAGNEHVGKVTRAVDSPCLDEPLALALVDYGTDLDDVTVRVASKEVSAAPRPLPFVEGSDTSARIPDYRTGSNTK